MKPIFSDQIQYFMDISSSTTADFENVTSLLSVSPARDKTSYAPNYIERSVSPEWQTGGTFKLDFQMDAMEDSDLHEFLMSKEHTDNVQVKVVRVKRFEAGTTTGTYAAEQATFNLNMAPLGQEANAPVKLNASLSMVSDGWSAGTWTKATSAFAPAAG